MSDKSKRAAYMARVQKHQAQRVGMMFSEHGERVYAGPEKIDSRNSAAATYLRSKL
jgi:hypothetical protein